MNMIIAIICIAAVSYLIGSVNFAIIVSKAVAREDIRTKGSGNAGMTNILRTYGKGPAAVTAVGDFSKAILAIALSRVLFNHFGLGDMIDAGYIAGIFVLLGHIRPLYFGFRGGKGVMTTLGIIVVINPLVGLIIAAVFIPVMFITKIVSIGSVLGAIAYPVITWLTDYLRGRTAVLDIVFAVVYMVIVLYMHKSNIKRLLNGTENKFGQKK
ncbi:MAG: glycerol-3-phosphate 1-O-acyltransferase PlsY [Oscillospiraceae bacterium]|nr:glycerol-3-phosphate 1-O-acyltransferase PlsY [Oscillospiraceae bacterium]